MKNTTAKPFFNESMSDLMSVHSDIETLIHVENIEIVNLIPGRMQARKEFDLKEVLNLAETMRSNGLIHPIIIRKAVKLEGYEIIAGERRWRAAQHLGWERIPAIVKDVSDREAYAIALVENLQREDLNPIEEASGYKELLEKHGLTHEQVAESVGKSRSTVSNFIRLLELDDSVQELLKHKEIGVGHAKLLVSLSKDIQGDLANRVVSKLLSVRQLETLIKRTIFSSNKPKLKRPDDRFGDIALFLKRKIGEDFEVSISKSLPNKISFVSAESLAKFMELLV